MSNLADKLTHPLVVKKKISETKEAFSFQLEIPADKKETFAYKAGQFVTLFMTIDGEEVNRSYSLCTSPSKDSEFQITVKRVHGGKGSNYLADSVKKGDTLKVTPPQGTFFKFNPETTHYYLFAAGSGITPVYSILKEVLTSQSSTQVCLVYGNRSEDEIIYKEELKKLEQEFGSRLNVAHKLSCPVDTSYENKGRCDEHYICEFIKGMNPPKTSQAYMCGPEGFMDAVTHGLQNAGFSNEQILKESFGAAPSALAKNAGGPDTSGKTIIGDTSSFADPVTIKATFMGESVEVPANPNVSILETLIEAGHSPPYSCMDGACMACMAKVVTGAVVQDDPGILTDDNIDACEALTCQAKPLSKEVVVDFDNF